MPDAEGRQPPPAVPVGEAIAAIVQAISDIEGPLPPKKRAIVEHAVLTFAEKGFDAASTKEIAQRAGVAEATIFRHFATKEELLLRLVQPVLSRIVVPAARDQFDRVAAEQGGRVEDVLRVVLTERLRVVRRYAPLVRILVQEVPFRPELRDLILSQVPVGLGGALEMIARESAAGRMIEESPMRIARWIGSLTAGYFIASTILAPGEGWDDDAEVAAFVKMLARGLLKDASER